MNWKAQLSF